MPTTTPTSTPLTPYSDANRADYKEDPVQLQEHVQGTYFSLRYGIAALGFALPILLIVIGRILGGVGLQSSMSAYYYAGNGAARNEFVGVLITVGAFLYLYKGFSRQEEIALNIAGLLAAGIALFPMQWNCGDSCSAISAHGVFAVLFFLSIAYVCLARAMDTLPLLKDVYPDDPKRAEERIAFYKRRYKFLGWAMVVSPIAALIGNWTLQQSAAVFFIEMFAVWVFAAYWYCKSKELKETDAELLAVKGNLRRIKKRNRLLPDDAEVRAR